MQKIGVAGKPYDRKARNDQQQSGQQPEQQHDPAEARLVEPAVKFQAEPGSGEQDGQAR